MSSWASSPFPAEGMRRRSRSRSPDRRMYYERDWNREREWADYERERVEWDYRRPSGMRSPGFYDDRRQKRRRSMSPPYPYERDRFEGRPRYGEEYNNDYRGQPPGRFSPPQRGFRPYSPPRATRGPADPRELDYPATFRHFNEWFRLNFPGVVAEEEPLAKNAENDHTGKFISPMKRRYDEYRKGITNNQIQILFDHHKTSAWFLERYDLSEQYSSLRARTRKIGWKGKIDEFIYNLEQGQYDPGLELDATVMPTNGATTASQESNKAESNGENGGDVDMMNEESRQDEEMDIAMFDNEANNDGAMGTGPTTTAANENRQNASATAPEEVSVEPEGVQIMIRTIPPDIGRVKIEEICSKIPGFMYLALGDPMQKRNYYRCGWIRFADDVDVSDVVAKLSEAKIDGFRMQVSHSTRPFVSKKRMIPGVASAPDRVIIDLERMRKLASILEEQADQLAQMPLEESDAEMKPEITDRGTQAVEARIKFLSEMLDRDFSQAEEERLIAKKNAIALDLYLAYLRYAFHCCYYCAAIADHSEELLRKCIKHGRAPPANTSDWKEARWIEWLDSKIALLVDRDNVDPVAYGGKDPQKELSKLCDPHLKREDEGKFRCNLCSKLFKAESFVEKHIANKHAEFVSGLQELPFYNMFALDPHRIQPFTHPPPATGNQQPPPQAYGLRPPAHREVPNGGGYDAQRQQYPPYGHPPGPPPPGYGGYGEYPPSSDAYSRRRSPPGRRRLSDRLGDRQYEQHQPLILSGIEGLPPKPSTVAEPMASERSSGPSSAGGAPPPPPKVKEDPRAAAGRKVSYLDMDEVAEGDIELNY